MPNEIATKRTLSLSRPVELPPRLVAMLAATPASEPLEDDRSAGFMHTPADPETVAWNRAREAEWEAAHPPPAPRFVHQEADDETRAHNQQREAAWHAELARLEVLLRELCPSVFNQDAPLPLQIGISTVLCDLLRGEFDGTIIGSFLGCWTRRPAYIAAIARGGPRYDLDGCVCGEVTEAERASRGGKS